MLLHPLNPWDLTPAEAVSVQKELAGMVRGGPLPAMRAVLGVDVSYRRGERLFHAAAVLLSFPDLEVLGAWSHRGETSFPYVPGLLSFREIPPLIPVLKRCPTPDLIMVDGHGIAHPRGLGLASHLGLLTRVPTVGCAKRLLSGRCREPGLREGDFEPVTLDGRRVGFALRSRVGCRPVYVSPGHLLTPENALEAVRSCLRGYRLPEPTRLADKLSREGGPRT